MEPRELDALRRLARQAADRPFFLAGVLAAYREMEGLDDAGLAAYLGCTVEDLPLLALCRRPDVAPEAFRADVQQLAQRFGIAPDRLANAVRSVGFRGALRQSAPGVPPAAGQERLWLLAAHDREDATVNEEPSGYGAELRDADEGTPGVAGEGEPEPGEGRA